VPSDAVPRDLLRQARSAPGRDGLEAVHSLRPEKIAPERISPFLISWRAVASPRGHNLSETSFEKLIHERQFLGPLQAHTEVFFRLSNSLLAPGLDSWNKRHFYQLASEADALESFLDDYGARFNRTYSFLTELVASLRWFAHSGHSLSHMIARLESYGARDWGTDGEWSEATESLEEGRAFLRATAVRLIEAVRAEAQRLSIELTPESFPEASFTPVVARRRLPRSVGQAELQDEDQKIAEVVTKYSQACQLFADLRVRRIGGPKERHAFFSRVCTEALARTYEATVHNLQSTYDTNIQNTVLEARDERLSSLRGRASAALHLLQAVTHMAHFIERHENDIRSEEAKRKISALVERAEVESVALNVFLYWADQFLRSGASLAEVLLPEYTKQLKLEIELADHLDLHARPAALIVGIVNHHSTPVEMEVGGKRCNAGSILELLVAVASQPHEKHFSFVGDERPVRDIERLFLAGLGEEGLETLPDELDYLRFR
jgi:phosphotransferase system HPr-like phosphotransfer protein